MYHMNLVNVSECGDMSIRGVLFQWVSTISIQLSVLVYYKANLIIISFKINLWMNSNMLKINADKTEVIVFTSKKKRKTY